MKQFPYSEFDFPKHLILCGYAFQIQRQYRY